MKAVWNERLQTVIRVFLYIVLIVFLIRNTFDIYYQFAGASGEENKTQNQVGQEVPEAAKTAAKVFLENWYFYKKDLTSEEKDRRMKQLKLVSSDKLFNQIDGGADLGVDLQNDPLSQQDNPQLNQVQSVQPNQSGQTNSNGFIVEQVEIWEAKWLDQKQEKVLITARLQTSDDHIFYSNVEVGKSGETWLVESIPAIVAEPQPLKEVDEEEPIEMDPDQKELLKSNLESFFKVWLGGDTVATNLYTENKPIPTSNILESLDAEFVKVSSIEIIKENPVQAKVGILIRRKDGILIPCQYLMQLEQKGDKWIVQSIQ